MVYHMKRIAVVFLAVMALGVAVASVVAVDVVFIPDSIVISGDLRSDRIGKDTVGHWSAYLSRDGRELSGSIVFPGRTELSTAEVEGEFLDDSISGVLRNDAGVVVAWFDGAVGDTGVEGTFEAASGEKGTWSWNRVPVTLPSERMPEDWTDPIATE